VILNIREYSSSDLESVSRISNFVYKNNKGSSSLIDNIVKERMIKKIVAVDKSNKVIGYGLIWEQATHPLIIRIELQVHNEYQSYGVLDSLYSYVHQFTEELKPRAIQTRLFEEQINELHFFKSRNFVEDHKMIKVYLPVNEVELVEYQHIEGLLNKEGISITALSREMLVNENYYNELKMLINNLTLAKNLSSINV
jgi:hypothetical protein